MSTRPKPESRDNVRQIVEGIYQIRVPLHAGRTVSLEYVNTYLVRGNDGWLMVDTGWNQPSSFESLGDSLHGLELDFKDIRTIILTHGHPDHYGMAGQIRRQGGGGELLCHRWEADMIESRYIKFSGPRADIAFLLDRHGVPEADLESLGGATMPMLEMVAITVPDRMLYGGEVIEAGPFTLEVIWTPGHSPGHICLYEPRYRLLFCGDHVLPTITPNVGYHVLSGDNPLGDYYCALGKLTNLDVKLVLPGHEQIFTDLRGRISAILEHHYHRESEIAGLIRHGFSNSYEIAKRLSWSINLPWDKFPPFTKRAAITETIAHLEHMRWGGKVSKRIEGKRISYGPA